MSTHRWAAAAAALLALSAFLPHVGADGSSGSGDACIEILTAQSGSGVRLIEDLGDQIAVGLSSGIGVPASAVLVIIPALCDIPNPWDAIGDVEHTSSGAAADPSTPDLAP
jgi:hypothetical protein